VQKQRSEFKISPIKHFQKNINELYGVMMDCLGDIGVILFGLKYHFWGQKEWFKTILGPVLGFFSCYYSWLPWPDPKRFSIYSMIYGKYAFEICINEKKIFMKMKTCDRLQLSVTFKINDIFHSRYHSGHNSFFHLTRRSHC